MTIENDTLGNDGFENSPNMVPGAVESAQQIDTDATAKSGGNVTMKLAFVVAALMFAGGWSYANRNDLGQALGYSTTGDSACSASTTACAASMAAMESTGGCCSEKSAMTAELAATQAGFVCPLTAMAQSEEGSCCAKGQSSALAAALLAEPEAASESAESTEAVAVAEVADETTGDASDSTKEETTEVDDESAAQPEAAAAQ